MRRGRGSVGQIFAIISTVEKCIRKGRKLCATFVYLKRADDMVDRRAIREVLMICVVVGTLVEEM